MTTKTTAMENTRDRIVAAADQLLYEKGFEYTAFADIADAVGISRGNVTFHFPTREAVLSAVIEVRLERTRRLLAQWEADAPGCADRIRSFINILITNRSKILLYGCPAGTLCSELAKLDHPALPDANRVFELFRDWLQRQFAELGYADEAEPLALHVLAWSQGIATLAQSFRDETFVRREVRQLEQWLDELAARAARGPAKSSRPSLPTPVRRRRRNRE